MSSFLYTLGTFVRLLATVLLVIIRVIALRR